MAFLVGKHGARAEASAKEPIRKLPLPLGKYPEDSLSLRERAASLPLPLGGPASLPLPLGEGLLLSLSLWERAGVRGQESGAAGPLTLTLSPREREKGLFSPERGRGKKSSSPPKRGRGK